MPASRNPTTSSVLNTRCDLLAIEPRLLRDLETKCVKRAVGTGHVDVALSARQTAMYRRGDGPAAVPEILAACRVDGVQNRGRRAAPARCHEQNAVDDERLHRRVDRARGPAGLQGSLA